jgi:glycosyltransferase involved in cell wall biosynthesis
VPTAKLIVTGPLGPHNPANVQYFEKLIAIRNTLALEENVHFLAEFSDEFLPDEVVSDFYHLADALFMPSREEGFGIPVLEAGLAGIPVFCADIPPLKDLGQSFANYFSLEEQPAEIAAMIWENLSASTLFQFRKYVRSEFTWRQLYEQQIQPLLERVNRK